MRYLLGVMFSLLLFGCTDQQAPVQIKVKVKNSQEQAIAGAVVKLNGAEVGTTDAGGNVNIEAFVPVQQSNRIEIVKTSRSYYYAPYYDSFIVQNEEMKSVPVNATMYFVPKPDAPTESVDALTTTESPGASVAEEVTETATVPEAPKPEVAKAEEQEKTAEDIKVLPVMEEAEAEPAKKQEVMAPEVTVFTVHVYAAGRPLGDATVYVGNANKGSLKDGCKTNGRGRCVLRYETGDVGRRTLVVSKSGFVTKTAKVNIVHGSKVRFDMKRGFAIDIFAMENRYHYKAGIKNAEVFVKGQKVGRTDEFGHLTYTFAGKKNDLVDIAIKAPGFLPAEYESDFVLAEPISVVRYFTPVEPQAVRVAVMKAQPAGKLTEAEVRAFSGALNRNIANAIGKHVFRLPAFERVSLTKFNAAAQSADRSLGEMLKKGWQDSEIKGEVDALFLPTVVLGDTRTLELSVVDSSGKIVVAAKETLDHLGDYSAIEHAVEKIAKRLRTMFPFEGAVAEKDGDKVILNFGTAMGLEVAEHSIFDVYGTQVGKYGNSHDISKIAQLRVVDAGLDSIVADVTWLAARSTIRVGDAVVYKGGKAAVSKDSKTTAYIRVKTTSNGADSPVSQANIYLNERWLGSTDSAGRLYLSKDDSEKRGMLRVVRRGFKEFSRELTLKNRKSIDIRVIRQRTFLTIESEPSNAQVFVDGKAIGKTPIMTPAPVPSGFVKLEVKGSDGYKAFSKVIELGEGTIDLTGGKKIVLEKDYQAVVRSLRSSGRFLEAVERLKTVPKKHSDYLNSQHQIGEIYLSKLGEPALAANAFGNVTSHPAVSKFVDKRFIGTHINEGVALFEAAERLQTKDAPLAAAHYAKSAEIFGRVSSQLRFVPEEQYDRAVNNVGYHHAYALHKLWFQSKDPGYLTQAYKGWTKYLETVDPKDKSIAAMVENAKVYKKQAEADLNAAGKVQ